MWRDRPEVLNPFKIRPLNASCMSKSTRWMGSEIATTNGHLLSNWQDKSFGRLSWSAEHSEYIHPVLYACSIDWLVQLAAAQDCVLSSIFWLFWGIFSRYSSSSCKPPAADFAYCKAVFSVELLYFSLFSTGSMTSIHKLQISHNCSSECITDS